MRIIFYVSGSKRKGTAHMDLKKVLVTQTDCMRGGGGGGQCRRLCLCIV